MIESKLSKLLKTYEALIEQRTTSAKYESQIKFFEKEIDWLRKLIEREVDSDRQ